MLAFTEAMASDGSQNTELRHRSRWRLMGDLLAFQGKLLVDGLKDLVLSPVAFIAVVIGILSDRHYPARYFDRMMRVGRDFDRWVDLFGTETKAGHSQEPNGPGGLDAHISRLKAAITAQQHRGGMTDKARQAIERALDALERNDNA